MILMFTLFFWSFQGITGSTIKIDENGDSEGNYTVLAFRTLKEKYKVDNFSCDFMMQPIGQFQIENSHVIKHVYDICLILLILD